MRGLMHILSSTVRAICFALAVFLNFPSNYRTILYAIIDVRLTNCVKIVSNHVKLVPCRYMMAQSWLIGTESWGV